MSTQGIILLLLGLAGFLIVGWVTMYVLWTRRDIDDLEERTTRLEHTNEINAKSQAETLQLVQEIHKGIKNVG